MVDDLFVAQEIEKGDSAMVEESIGERERTKFVEGLNRLALYKPFSRCTVLA